MAEPTNPTAQPASEPAPAPTEVSLEERVAAKFGIKPETEEDTPLEPTEETPTESEATPEATPEAPKEDSQDFAEVEYEGKHYSVPAEIKDALLRQADYTRKTQEVAERRKAADGMLEQAQRYAQLVQGNSELLGQLAAYDQQIKQYEGLNWDQLAADDPAQANRLFIAYSRLKDQRQETTQKFGQAQSNAEAEIVKMVQAKVQEGHQLLAKEMKGWGPDLQKAIATTGREYGFSADELNAVYDPRMVKVLHDAHQWRALQTSRPAIEKRVAQQVKTIAPKPASTQTSAQEQRSQLRREVRTAKTDSEKAKAIERLLIAKMRH